MNISEDGLRKYIEVFLSTLEATAHDYLEPDLRGELLHLSLLPAKIKGYVSTNFGTAIEYQPAQETSIEIQRGSARVEDLFVAAPAKLRNVEPIIPIGGSGWGIYKLSIKEGFPFRLTSREASVSFGEVRFEAGPWVRDVHYAEVFGDRASDNWSTEKAVFRAKDEVLTALVQVQRAAKRKVSVQEYIGDFKEKTVLLLGDYDQEGLMRLGHIRDALVELGYEPILIKDIPDHPHHNLPQKVVAIGSISRFVVVDDSSKSGHLVEWPLCKQNDWVTVLLRAGGRGGTWMTAGASHSSKVVLEQSYDPTSPALAVQEAATWAEDKLNELERKFENTYPWRQADS